MGSMGAPRSPFPGFNQLAPSTWYYQPAGPFSNGSTSSATQPSLVVLSTWMSAASKHILKYTTTYQKLYPKASLLVFTNGIWDIIFRPKSQHEQHFKAAISVIRSAEQEKPNAKILLHVFSNGGAHAVCQLATLYRAQYGTALPITSMVFDSAPGRGTYRRSIAAMSVGLPRFWPLRMVALLFLHFVCIVMWCRHHIFHLENVITRVRRQLNSPLLLPLEARRVYVYSKTDEMVGWQDVEEHARLAEEQGWQVKLELFRSSKHVGHSMEDPDRYWGVVEEVLSNGGK